MSEVISIKGLELRFLHSKADTQGSLDMFEMIVQPHARMPVAHYHESWDETVYGLEGKMTFRIGDGEVGLSVGETLFIPRGTVHAFRNDGQEPATCLVVLTPGVLGIDYFREVAALLASDTPDLAQMGAIMRRYGLIPAPLN
ncbi:cupin domain-containing protein [Labrys portucalensis]|uniref:Cupin domain-containing protein n=1 Tax=Labrys neptuniae TaxID=376174 RepID=A0ABV6ZEX1_9HYPH|nr:cupin domain-containing protein [Labrys neptuniae]MDT3377285.1 cupin domain-containing protein [Labrys neptuniae]